MSGYQQIIIEATGCDPKLAPAVEELMRITYRTLDGLDRKTFKREARIALETYHALDADTQAFYRGEEVHRGTPS